MAIRELDTYTLSNAAKDYAAWFIADKGKYDRAWVMQQFYNFTFKDEFEFLVEEVKTHLGPVALADFEGRVSQLEPRSDEVFFDLLEQKRPVGYEPGTARLAKKEA